mgnify:CR=1 FL=1
MITQNFLINFSMIMFSSSLITILLFYFKEKITLGEEKPSKIDRKIHISKVTRLGGLSFIPLLLLVIEIDNNLIRNIIYFSYFIFFIGFIEDVFLSISQYVRFLAMLFLVSIFLLQNNFYINDFQNQILNYLFVSNILISYCFSLLGFMLIINGFNFIDGVNGLLLGMCIIISGVYAYHSYNVSNDIFSISICMLACCLILYYLNISTGKILVGDGGAYFIGFLLGAISIYICNLGILNSLNVAFLLFYPIIEVCLSFFRRFFKKDLKSFHADNFHLHQLVYFSLKETILKKNISINDVYINSLSSVCILFPFLMMILFGELVKDFINNFYILISFCAVYLFFYSYLFNKYKNN